MAKVEITPATVREVAWISANMRKIDAEEIWCQRPHRSPSRLAYEALSMSPNLKYVAAVDGEPVFCCGVSELQPGLGWLWAWGTKRYHGAMRGLTDFLLDGPKRELFTDANIKRLEARSIATHTSAHRWIEKLGLRYVCDLPCYGKDEEDFKLFALTRNEVGYDGDS